MISVTWMKCGNDGHWRVTLNCSPQNRNRDGRVRDLDEGKAHSRTRSSSARVMTRSSADLVNNGFTAEWFALILREDQCAAAPEDGSTL